ncbi:MAG: aminotransferase class IV, partial [Kiloniellales bacterium]|nr:aminotransferase class IV [Kiloniellales bacterium]
LERAPRGVYTGAIGMLAPDGDALFNVAIRTLFLDGRGGGQLGVGSGIVQDSDPQVEWEECLLKARFLTAERAPFQLIETLRWQRDGGYYLLDRHLDRLAASAAFFGYPCDAEAIRAHLAREAERFAEAPVMRVRLLLDEDGALTFEAGPMEMPGDDHVLTFVVSDRRVSSGDTFIYHKTTRRELYDREFERHRKAGGYGEVVFLNERGEVTEGSRTTLFIEQDGVLVTPPLRCGLLAGTLRRDMIEDPSLEVVERPLSLADLEAADRVYLGNSVRGLMRARRST